MSVTTERPNVPPPERTVKHPMAWYMPRFWHGMRLSTWLRELARNRLAVSPSRIPMTCAITGFTGINSVLAGVDRLVYGRQVDATKLKQPPVFILGHWRSGTTFLHELMIRDPQHTYFTTYQCFTPHHFVLTERKVVPWIGIFVPERRPMDNMAAGWDRPMEDEFALQSLGVPTPYLSTMFPNRGEAYPEYLTLRDLTPAQRESWKHELLQFCKRLTLRDDRRIVIKSPAHTARVRTLLEMFPDAKFIHISRDPYALFRSTLGLWHSLNSEEGLQAIRDEGWLDDFVIDSLQRMYDAYFEDRQLLGPNQLVELSYEELVEDPKTQVRSIYERLDLGDFARIEPALDDHLADVKNYRTNRHAIDDESSERIRRDWARYFAEFGYE
ncbi:sulfotransferase family protein [Lacipirellula sp.]|uniref:sulfotransferase family protein n=1 Tax=Lacipirellula sp. TaxID=2691419 RepID=UPI003D0D5A42